MAGEHGHSGEGGEQAAGVCDRRGPDWGPGDQVAAMVSPLSLLFVSLALILPSEPGTALGSTPPPPRINRGRFPGALEDPRCPRMDFT